MPKNLSQKIEYPKLKKIGGLWNFVTGTLIQILIIFLISASLGYWAGHSIQKKFSDLTGYNKKEVVAVVQENAMRETPKPEAHPESIKNDGLLQNITNSTVNLVADSLETANNALVALSESEILQKTNEFSKTIISKALKPVTDVLGGLLKFLYLTAFWIPFCFIFLISAWLTHKLLFAKRYLLTNGVDPLVIKNMEALEAKVKELVDRANQTIES